jgi:N-acetylmuramate 1-kinase
MSPLDIPRPGSARAGSTVCSTIGIDTDAPAATAAQASALLVASATTPPTSAGAVHWPDPRRRAAFDRWLAGAAPAFGLDATSLTPASADASFRRYLRLRATALPEGTAIVMDAPPPLEDVRPFCHVATLLRDAGLAAPAVLAAQVDDGFVLLSDLGQSTYLDALRDAAARGDAATLDALMLAAIQALVRLQQAVPAVSLPPFDEALLRSELDLFPVWCVHREHGITWGPAERHDWDTLVDRLVQAALAQPQVAVHADWMPRNLMLPAAGPGAPPGVLDFQDAVRGPIGYDIASLLRDAFVSWDEAQELDWAIRWWQAARAAGLPVDADFAATWRDIEWIGLQRHLKVLGIFCRLKHRDGKAAYAADLPRFFGYAQRVAMRYRELRALLPLLAPMSGAGVQAGFTF